MSHRHSQSRVFLAIALLAASTAALADSRALFDAGDFADAVAVAREELERTPGALDPLLVLGQAQLTLGKTAEAVATLRKAASLHPDSGEAFYRLGQALTLHVAASSTWRRMFMAGDIGDAFGRAVELAPSNASFRWALFEFCRHAPPMVGGGRKKARAHAAALAKIDPARGHRAKAALLLQDGDVAGAEKELQTAIEVDKAEADHRYALGYFYQDQERWDDAFAQFDRIARDFPEELEAQFQIGKTAALSGRRIDDGIRALQRYLQYKPKAGEAPPAWAHFRLGQLHEHQRDRAAAKASYEAALKLDPRLMDAREALTALNS
jgi:tetratricopeptide (TPR) repeat protein